MQENLLPTEEIANPLTENEKTNLDFADAPSDSFVYSSEAQVFVDAQLPTS